VQIRERFMQGLGVKRGTGWTFVGQVGLQV